MKNNSLSRSQHKENFLNPIWKQNPLFVLLLGTCPALAVTTTIENAIGMGILFTFVLVGSSVLVSLLRKVIPEEVETPAFIIIIATFVTIVKMAAEAFVPELYTGLGVFISLLVVNCIVLGRAEAFAKKNSVFDSFLDALGNGIGYIIAILIIAVVREILGTGTITFGAVFTFIPKVSIPVLKFDNVDLSISLFAKPAGGFIVYGVIEAIIAAVNVSKAQKEAALKRAAILKAQAEKAAAQKAKLAQEAK
ncbi:MAG TPA: hypothetical protein DDW18_04870 [Firmicutes bacterium]|nr:hypothetical protein [Bacillota bacterium]HBN00422.1 hypothetical protein [Bacillota bacterium]